MKNKLSLILILLIFTSSLFANNFNVGLYEIDSNFDLKSLINDFITVKFTLTAAEKTQFDNIYSWQQQIINAKAINDNYTEGKLPSTKEVEEFKYSLNISCTALQKNEKIEDSITNGDKLLLSQICLDKGLNLILISKTTKVSEYSRYRIFAYDPSINSFTVIFNKLYQTNFLDQDEVLKALLPVFYTNYSLVHFTNYVPVKVDSYKVVDSQLVLPIGTYSVYNTSFEVKREKEQTIDINKPINSVNGVYFNSKIGQTNLLFNNQLEFTTPYYIDNIDLPYTLKISKDGFMPTILQINDNTTNFNFNLRPEWFDTSTNYEKSRKNFYGAFALSIGLYSAKVIVKSLNQNNSTLYNNFYNVLNGLFMLNLLNVADKLFDYYNAGANITP